MTGFPYPELDAEKEAEYHLFPINLTRMLLHTQGQTVPYWKHALGFRNAKIPPVVRERVIVRVGAVTDCEYQLVQHKTEALRTGTSPELLADLVNPQQQEFDDPSLTALISYVDSFASISEPTRHPGRAAKVLSRQRNRRDHPAGWHLRPVRRVSQIAAGPLDDGPVDWAAADAYIKKEGP